MRLPWDKLVNLAMRGYEATLGRLFAAISTYGRFEVDPYSVVEAEVIKAEPDFANLLSDLTTTTTLTGMAEPVQKMDLDKVKLLTPWRKDYLHVGYYGQGPQQEPWGGVLPVGWDAYRPVAEAARDSIKKLNVVTRTEFDAMAQGERNKAFTVTGIQSKKALAKIKNDLDKSMYQGLGRQGFEMLVKKTFNKSALGPDRMEMVYRVGTTKAYHSGQDKVASNPVIADAFPYVRVMTINDSRRTLACALMENGGLNKTNVYRRDDPAYLRNRTPRHYNCRCKDVLLTVAQAARLGVREAIEWQKRGTPPTVPEYVPYFEVPMPKGWNNQPSYTVAA